MIGGEFDLSVGSIVGVSGMSIMLLTTELGWSVWPAIATTFVICLVVGFLNGYTVVRTQLPSFIVTLATLFILRGLTIAAARGFTRRTQLGGLDDIAGYELARLTFGSAPVAGLRVSIVWWLGAPPSPRGFCCARPGVTGYSPPVANRKRPATSACAWRA